MRNAGLDEVPGAVQLMPVYQVGPALARFLEGIVGVHITVRPLRLADERHGFVQLRVHSGVGREQQAVAGGLNPLVQIAVLKNHALKLAFFQPRGDTEIAQHVAGFRVGHAVVKRLPLVGEHGVLNDVENTVPKFIPDANVLKFYGLLHRIPFFPVNVFAAAPKGTAVSF